MPNPFVDTESLPLHRALQLSPQHTVAIVGAGGKTTAMWRLAQERRRAKLPVLVTTSTHIFPPAAGECDLFCSPHTAQALLHVCANGKIVCAAFPTDAGKCTGLSPEIFHEAEIAGLHPLYEADGSKRLPAKLHSAHEPVLHAQTDHVLLVAGLHALGQPVSAACHRYALSARMAAQPMRLFDEADLLETVLEGAAACEFSAAQISILLNQADTSVQLRAGERVAAALRREGLHTVVGSLQNSKWP